MSDLVGDMYSSDEWRVHIEDDLRMEQAEKRCTGPCDRLLPATTEFFHRQKAGKYGVTSCCKECSHKNRNAYYQENKQHVLTKHKEWRESHPEYHQQYRIEHAEEMRVKSKIYHKEHAKEIGDQKRAYYQQHAEEILPIRKEYARANAERVQQYRKRRYQKHAEEMRSQKRVYYQEHRQQRREYSRKYYKTEQGRMTDRAHRHKRRSQKRDVLGTHTSAQIQEQLKRQRYRCYYADCGHAKFQKVNGQYIYQIDHTFPLSRVVGTDIPANDISYLVLACPSCNSKKHNKFPWEWPEGGRLF